MIQTFKKGDKVIFTDAYMHQYNPECYPAVGTVGTILKIDGNTAEVMWDKGSTSEDDIWWVGVSRLGPVPQL